MSKIPNKMEKVKTKGKERLVLLDSHAILHRAYHALPEFATSKGEPTGALYGFVSMILKIVSDLKPDYIVACYDLPKPTYRHEVYEGYKAGRAKTDGDLVLQLEKSKEVCSALGVPIYSKEGFEADDILGTIVEQLKDGSTEIIIASGDMDTLQLVDDNHVKVYTLKKGINDTILYDEKAVRERFGFGPELLPDYKGLRGDPSDNIIGIEGIGEKTATELIIQYGSVENIYKEIRNSKSKARDKIKLRVLKLLEEGKEEAEFSKMLATIRRDAPIEFELPKKKWKEGINLEKAKEIFSQLEFRTMGARLEEVVKSSKQLVVSSQEKPEEKIEEKELKEVALALWVADSNLTDPGLEEILHFAKTDSFPEAKEKIFSELEKREVGFVFKEIEKPIMEIVENMQKRGILVDKKIFENLKTKYVGELQNIQKKIWEQAREEFNVSSPKQLAAVLFDKLGLSVKNHKKTGGGVKSTRESELEKMKDMHPVVPLVLEYREISKLINTYIEPIPKLLDGNSRLHARFIQAGTTTGRMASENPNLQNIPIGSERGRAIRNAFLASKGFKLVALDYSQIELRIAAFLSGDHKLIDIFKAGEDVHNKVASYVFQVSGDGITKEMRRRAKVINFGILYGMGVNALQSNLGTDRKTAQEFYNKYFSEFPGLAEYLDKTKEEAGKNGYTKTFFGRRRYFEGIKSKIPYIKAMAERMAVNAPIQGTQADVTKIAMRRVWDWIRKEKFEDKIHLILQIHDELVYEIEESLAEKAALGIKKIMEEVLPSEKIFGVPIVANILLGDNWGEMRKFELT